MCDAFKISSHLMTKLMRRSFMQMNYFKYFPISHFLHSQAPIMGISKIDFFTYVMIYWLFDFTLALVATQFLLCITFIIIKFTYTLTFNILCFWFIYSRYHTKYSQSYILCFVWKIYFILWVVKSITTTFTSISSNHKLIVMQSMKI